MQDIREESLNESVKSEQSPRVVLWEIDLTVQGGERYFFCNELNEKGEPVTWQGRKYEAYPIDGSGFEMNGRGSSARPSLTVSNLFGLEHKGSGNFSAWVIEACRRRLATDATHLRPASMTNNEK
jgi:lambda family phage minor tail protein L